MRDRISLTVFVTLSVLSVAMVTVAVFGLESRSAGVRALGWRVAIE